MMRLEVILYKYTMLESVIDDCCQGHVVVVLLYMSFTIIFWRRLLLIFLSMFMRNFNCHYHM